MGWIILKKFSVLVKLRKVSLVLLNGRKNASS
jgi:hypothetical protein